MSLIGTACFEDTLAAIRYYKAYGYTRDDVKAKILCKEILIGKPNLREGESLYLDNNGQYHLVIED